MRRLRRWYWQHVRRYRGEICDRCGRPVARGIGWQTYWGASDITWRRVMGDTSKIVCPACFTRQGRRSGYPVKWSAEGW